MLIFLHIILATAFWCSDPIQTIALRMAPNGNMGMLAMSVVSSIGRL
jgi:hypothetical protein